MKVRTRRTAAMIGTVAVLLASPVAGPARGADPAGAGGVFSPVGSLGEARMEHTATLLQDGGILVVGGTNDDGILDSAELWDAVSGSFSPTGSLAEARASHTATLLETGGVLVVGGYNDDEGSLATAELWDPVSGSFSPTGSLSEARNSHTATLLSDGRVLVVGGLTNDRVSLRTAAEVWDPDSGTFSPAGSLAEGRAGHTATLTPDGVLVIGGVTNDDVVRASAELWDPGSESFVPAGTIAEGRVGHTATVQPDGVLVVGGYGGGRALTSAEWWDPGSGSFSPAGSLSEARGVHTATLLPDGSVLVIGGLDVLDFRAVAERWEPAGRSFSPGASLTQPRGFHTATLLVDGDILVIGGLAEDGSPTASAELLSPDGGTAPDPSPSDELDGVLDAVALMNNVPPAIMASCVPSTPSLDGQRAVVQCSSGVDTVVYASFQDEESLAAAYEGIAASAGVVGGTSCAEGAFEGPYDDAAGTQAGRVVCQVGDDGALLAWTDVPNLVMGFLALGERGGFAELFDHWLAVRLDAGSAAGATPSPGGATAEPDGTGTIRQWAIEATASSEYTSTDWSAAQATGDPDAPAYGSYPVSWAPYADPGEPEWIELSYAVPVVPTAVHIWEANGAGFVVKVEAWDEAGGDWLTLWEGTDPTPEQLMAFDPPLATTDVPTRRIRVTAGPGASGWPYIDAVELVGTAAPD